MACVRKRRDKWVIDFYDQFGKRHVETVGRNKKEAEEKLAQRTLDIRKGAYNPNLSKVLLVEYCKTWLETYAQVNNLKGSTVKSYKESLNNYILPLMGHLPLRSIRRKTIKQLIADLARKPLSRNSIRIVLATLRVVLNTAVDDEILAGNPAQRIGKFTKSRTERQQDISPLTSDELTLFLGTINKHFPLFYPFFLTLARTGLRLGESLALQWGDIDFENRLIEVKRGLVSGRIETPKNGKTRKVDMSQQLTATLKDLQITRKKETLRKGWRDTPEWVFCDSNGNPLDHNNLRKRVFHKALAKGGLRKFRIHDLRHTFASLLIQNGESLAYVRDQLGHHSIQVTVDIYGHLVPGGNKQAVDRLDDAPVASHGSKMVAEATLAKSVGSKVLEKTGATRRSRTGDLLITNQLLYQLS